MTLDENLAKSLEEIEAKAEEVLSKSEDADTEEKQDEEEEDDVEKGLTPEDVSSENKNSDEDDASDKDEKDAKEDDEDEDEKDEKDSEDGEEEEEETKKSITDQFLENETLSKSIEVSDFLAEFTRTNGGVLETFRRDIKKSLDTSAHTANILAKSFNAIMKSQDGLTKLIKSQEAQLTAASDLIKSLESRLESVERQPVVRKSVINTMEKSFDHSAGLANAGEKAPLSKSEKITKLTNMAVNGENGVTVHDVVAFESTGQIRPELEQFFN